MYACLQLPHPRLQAIWRDRPGDRYQPVAVLDDEADGTNRRDRGKARVCECSPEAAEFGIHPGMTASQARARCGDLLLRERAPAAEGRLREELLAGAERFTADFEETGPGLVTLDMAGIAGVERRPQEIGTALVGELEERGCVARAGLGANPDLARVAVRSLAWRRDAAEVEVVIRGEEARLDPLPLEVLDPGPDHRELFSLWGVETVADLKRLRRADLVERLGKDSAELWDLAMGRTRRLLRLVRPAPRFEAEASLEWAIEAVEPLLFTIRRLLETIVARLSGHYLVAGEIALRLDLVNGRKHRRRFRLPEPGADVDLLASLLHTHLADFRAEAAIEGVHLEVVPARAGRHQFDLFAAGVRDPNQLAETVARLEALLGPDRVGTPHVPATHRPGAVRMERFSPGGEPDVRIREVGQEALSLGGLPLRRLRPRLAVSVRCGNRVSYFGDRAKDRERPLEIDSGPLRGRIEEVAGPWRLSGDWWEKKLRWCREEWDARLGAGVLCRLVREGGDWYVEGVYG